MTISTSPDVIAWDLVNVPMTQSEHCAAGFRHCHTATSEAASRACPREGITIWDSEFAGQRLGLAWRWVVRGHRVIAMADPMRIISNARWICADGQPASQERSVLLLNELVHSLPWQALTLEHARHPRRRMDARASISDWERHSLAA